MHILGKPNLRSIGLERRFTYFLIKLEGNAKGSRPLHRYHLLPCDFLLSDNPESNEPVVQQQERKKE